MREEVLSKTDWIGGIGDVRVLCIDTMKIYSCPESCAYSINTRNDAGEKGNSVTPSDIKTNCNKFVKSIFNGMRFEWYNQYLIDTEIDDFYKPPEVIEIHMKEYPRYKASKNGQGPKKFYSDVRKIYRAIKKTYQVNPEIIGITLTIPDFLRIIGIERESYGSMTKHFLGHKEIYESLFDAEFSTFPSLRCSKDITSIKLNKFTNIGINKDVDQDWDIQRYFSTHHDSESSYMKGKIGSSKPIIRLEDKRVFGSIATASRLSGIDEPRIVWCCEGDIDHCIKAGMAQTFRYVKIIIEEKK